MSRRLSLFLLLTLAACGDDDAPLDATVDAPEDASSDAGVDAAVCPYEGGPAEELADPPRHTPAWAFEPWISKDISDRADTEAFVNGFLERDIPVGAVVLDSPWETHYNTFVPNPERYGDFGTLVEWLHERDVKIVLWVTQMVNNRSYDLETGGDRYVGASPNFRPGLDCGFFVNGGTRYNWWKGDGAAVDFFHPEAVGWWRAQQDVVLDAGIDGWKLDFGESYIRAEANSYLDVETYDGMHTLQEYSEAYYRDFLQYGVSKRGSEFVTMVRGYDVSYDIPARFYARPEHAPVVWLGDNHRDWTGVLDVLDHAFRSMQAGYVTIGSDIGGYLDRDENDLTRVIPYDGEVFARWIALSGTMPFFQLHGRANLEPWAVPDADTILPTYRYWATLHSEMVPFWYSLAEETYAGRATMMSPVGADLAAWQDDWRFTVGDTFLVAPLFESGDTRDVALPEGTWFDWYEPFEELRGTLTDYESTVVIEGLPTVGRVPFFVREGAIVPLRPRSTLTGLASEATAATRGLTWLIWPSVESTSFVLHEGETTITATAMDRTITLSNVPETTVLRVRPQGVVGEVTLDGTTLTRHADLAAFDAATTGYRVDDAGFAWIKVDPRESATIVVVPPG
ncbi:MAG: glycoside hydrolase family 31 protein [Sandaracinus sp.]|nr:glycoside hydrolase family 31 protein [Sandaracinus sp.]MCB9635904.1 glycoside hydrolase family 31 protein [Sandaracinus sp.]